jgi:transposase
VTYELPTSWQEAKIGELVDAVRAEPDVFERVRLVREHLADYARLAGAELIAGREAELDAERIKETVELLRETAPPRLEAEAKERQRTRSDISLTVGEGNEPGKSASKAAEMVGVSRATVENAKAIA